ncbi:MAG: zinc-binding dehydrogenase [Acidobacteria bacterium]|nr:zinc-binding dehydrogenase [Acidobacteriota bacterium]
MKALLLQGPRSLSLTDVASASLAPGQVRIRIHKVGICGSDYSSVAGKLPFTRFPIVPGHEASGEVTEAAAGSTWRPGDRVFLHPILCNRAEPVFGRGEIHHSDSTEVLGVVSRNGAYAEEVVVEDYMVRAMPDGLDFEAAAMIEPVAVAVRAVKEGLNSERDRVLIFGAGNIGLLVVQVAKALGAAHIAVTDVVPDRLELARRFGADSTYDASQPFPTAELEKKFDLIIDGVGTEETVRNALTASARGARIVVYGVPAGDIVFPLRVAFSKDVRLITSRLYDADFDLATLLVAEGRVTPLDIITHRIALADAPALFESVFNGELKPIKVMMTP